MLGALLLALLLRPAPARAQAQAIETAPSSEHPPRVEWKPEWREFGWEDYLITSLAAATAVGTQLIPEQPGRWGQQGTPFDETMRDALRVRSMHGSLYARDASDVLMLVSVTYPFLVDSLSVAWWHHQNPRVATEIGLISLEAMAVSSALQAAVSGLSSRERPYGRRCGAELSERDLDCTERNRYRSFFSGHTSIAFVSAAVTCTHHRNIPLFGGGAPDNLACVLGFANATAVGMLRVAADRHYMTDVLVGAGVGTLTGLALPWFLHYRPAEYRGYPGSLSLRVMPTPGGVGVGGDF